MGDRDHGDHLRTAPREGPHRLGRGGSGGDDVVDENDLTRDRPDLPHPSGDVALPGRTRQSHRVAHPRPQPQRGHHGHIRSPTAAAAAIRCTGSPPRRRAAARRVGAGTRVTGAATTPRVSRCCRARFSATDNGPIRSVRPCSLAATMARLRTPACRPSAKTGAPGSVRGITRCGSSSPTRSCRAHDAHHRVDATPQPPHSSGRIRSSMPAVCARAPTSAGRVSRAAPVACRAPSTGGPRPIPGCH